MKCEYCGRPYLPGEVACSGCGAPIENPILQEQNIGTQASNIEVNVGGVNIRINGSNVNAGHDTKSNQENEAIKTRGEEVSERLANQKQQEAKRNRQIQENTLYRRAERGLYAGLIVRSLAFWIDFIIIVFICVFIEDPIEAMLGRDVTMIIFTAYFVICEVFMHGATFGKKAMKIRVVNEEGKGISLWQGLIRFFAKFISLVAFGIGFLMIVFSSHKQGLHDRIATTYVVKS